MFDLANISKCQLTIFIRDATEKFMPKMVKMALYLAKRANEKKRLLNNSITKWKI